MYPFIYTQPSSGGWGTQRCREKRKRHTIQESVHQAWMCPRGPLGCRPRNVQPVHCSTSSVFLLCVCVKILYDPKLASGVVFPVRRLGVASCGLLVVVCDHLCVTKHPLSGRGTGCFAGLPQQSGALDEVLPLPGSRGWRWRSRYSYWQPRSLCFVCYVYRRRNPATPGWKSTPAGR